MSRYGRFRMPLVLKSSDCGANGPGGGGFQPGNTCGKEDGGGVATERHRTDTERHRTHTERRAHAEQPPLNDGDRVTIPASHTYGEIPAIVKDHENGQVSLVWDEPNHGEKPRRMITDTRETVQRFLSELRGELPHKPNSGNAYLDKVLSGQGQFLGAGQGGMAFDAGDKIVKASAIVPYHWNNGVRTAEQANEKLQSEIDIVNELQAAGVPGLLPLEPVMHEGRLFAVRDKVDLENITQEAIDDAGRALETMHAAGYLMRDQVQIGMGEDGKFRFFDVGEASKFDPESRWAQEDKDMDHSSLQRVAKEHGLNYVTPRDRDPFPKFEAEVARVMDVLETGDMLDLMNAQFELKNKFRSLQGLEPDTAQLATDYYEATQDMIQQRIAELEEQEKESERQAKVAKALFLKAADCGANGPGGGGFQPGNTCAAGDGGGSEDSGSRGGEKQTYSNDTPLGNLAHDPTKEDRKEFVKYVKDVATLKIRKDSLLAQAVTRALNDPTKDDRRRLVEMAKNTLTLNLGAKTAAQGLAQHLAFNPAAGDMAQIVRGVTRVADMTIGNLFRLISLPFRRRKKSAAVTKSLEQVPENAVVIDDVVAVVVAKVKDDPTPENLQRAILETVEAVLRERAKEDSGTAKSLFTKAWFAKDSNCGANGPGGQGFQPGNTCGKEDGSGGDAGPGKGKTTAANGPDNKPKQAAQQKQEPTEKSQPKRYGKTELVNQLESWMRNNGLDPAQKWTKEKGTLHLPSEEVVQAIADEQQAHNGKAPSEEILQSYEALKTALFGQYEALLASGLKVHAWKGEGEPYHAPDNPRQPDSNIMRERVEKEGAFHFFMTQSGFGAEGGADESSAHPMLARSPYKTADGDPMLVNDVFRVVHDAVAHIYGGYSFSTRGEMNGMVSHASTLPKAAHAALFSETFAQNSVYEVTGQFAEQNMFVSKHVGIIEELLKRSAKLTADTQKSWQERIAEDDDNDAPTGAGRLRRQPREWREQKPADAPPEQKPDASEEKAASALFTKDSGCGANGPGGGGFQPGNDCGRRAHAGHVQSPQFKRWFGESKAVDEDGQPLVLYHGTTAEFEEFENPFAESNITMVTSNPEYAGRRIGNDREGNIKAVYVKAERPLDLRHISATRGDARRKIVDLLRYNAEETGNTAGVDKLIEKLPFERDAYQIVNMGFRKKEMQEALHAAGYDSIVMNDHMHGFDHKGELGVAEGQTWVVFDSRKLKSVTGNSGEFDPSEKDIRKSAAADLLFAKAADCGANGPGGGGFQPGNDCGKKDGSGGDGKAGTSAGGKSGLTADDAKVYAKHRDKVVALAGKMREFAHGKAGPDEVKALRDAMTETGAGDAIHRIAQAVVDRQMDAWAAGELKTWQARQTATQEQVQAVTGKLQRFSPKVSDDFLQAQQKAVGDVLQWLPAEHAEAIAQNVRSVTIAADSEDVGLALAMETLDTHKAAAGAWVGETGALVLDGIDKYKELAEKHGTTTDAENVVDTLHGLAAHEMAHAIDAGKRISNSIEWTDAWVTEIQETRKQDVPRRTRQGYTLSAYAASSKSEGWAEYVRLVYEEPDKAIRHFPKAWAVFKTAAGSQTQLQAGVTKSAGTEPEPEQKPAPQPKRSESNQQRELFGEPIEIPGNDFPLDTWLPAVLSHGLKPPKSLVFPQRKLDAEVQKSAAALFVKASDCGANGPGGRGFQPGNTCAKEDGNSEQEPEELKTGTAAPPASAPAKPPAPVPDEQNPDIGTKIVPPEALQALQKWRQIAQSRSDKAGARASTLIDAWVAAVEAHGTHSTQGMEAMSKLRKDVTDWSGSSGEAIKDGMIEAVEEARTRIDEIEVAKIERDIEKKRKQRVAAAIAMKRGTKPYEVPLKTWLTRKMMEDVEKAAKLSDWAKRVDKTAQHLHYLEKYDFSDVPETERLPQEFQSTQELYEHLGASKEFKQLMNLRSVYSTEPKPMREDLLSEIREGHARRIVQRAVRQESDVKFLLDGEHFLNHYTNPYRDKYQEALTEQLVAGVEIPEEILREVEYEEWFAEFRPKLEMQRYRNNAQRYIESEPVKALAVDAKLRLDRARGQASQILASVIKAKEKTLEAVKAANDAEDKAMEDYFRERDIAKEMAQQNGEDHPDTLAAIAKRDAALQVYADAQEHAVVTRRESFRSVAKALELPPERRAKVTILPSHNATRDKLPEEVQYRLKEAEQFLSSIIDKDVVEHLEMVAQPLERGRHRANALGNVMRLSMSESLDVIIHEAGHLLENANDERLQRISTGFLANQLAGEKVRNLSEATGHNAFDPHEVAAKDGFLDHYTGKVYERGGTEILSMGLQRLYEGTTRFLTDSTEHAIYTIAAIRGLLTEAPPKPEPEPPQPAGKKRQRELFAKFLQLAECRAFMSQIVDKATQRTLFGDDCGANGPGGGGFQPGNTCGRASGRSGGGGTGRRRSRSEDASVRKFDFDAPKPKQDEPQPRKKRSEDDGSGGDAEYSKSIAKAAEIESRIWQNTTESLHAIVDGQEFMTIGGTESQVRVTRDDRDKLLEMSKKGKVVLTHNHPRGLKFAEDHPERAGSSFSVQDVTFAFYHNVHEMRAVTPKFVFRMWPNHGPEPSDENQRNSAVDAARGKYENIDSEVREEFTEKVQDGTLSVQQANATHFHEVMLRLSKRMGFKYTREDRTK